MKLSGRRKFLKKGVALAGSAVGVIHSANGQIIGPELRPNELYDYGIRSRFVTSKRIGTNESKVRVYAKKPKPFTEAYVKTEGYLLSCHKIEKKYSKFHNSRDGLADTAKKRKEDAYVFVLIPFEQKLMVVDLYKEGKQVRKYEYTEQIVTKRNCNATKEEAIPNFIIAVKDALFIKFELEDLSKKGQEIYKQVLNPDVH